MIILHGECENVTRIMVLKFEHIKSPCAQNFLLIHFCTKIDVRKLNCFLMLSRQFRTTAFWITHAPAIFALGSARLERKVSYENIQNNTEEAQISCGNIVPLIIKFIKSYQRKEIAWRLSYFGCS
jgi:hypothetical protein